MGAAAQGDAKRCDAIVVGGGPAGAAAGTVMARKGLSVLLMDRAVFPRPKPCGGLLTAKAAAAARPIFGDGFLDRAACGSSTSCRLYWRDDLVADVTGADPMLLARREDLDAAFLAEAERAGCRVLQGCKVVGVDSAAGEVRTASGETHRAAVVVGADGAAGVSRRAVDARGGRARRGLGFGLEVEVPREALAPDACSQACGLMPHVFFGGVAWGYGWVFPRGGRVSLGVGGLRARNPDLRGALRSLVEKRCVAGTFDRLRVRGHPVPFGNFLRRPGRGRLLLAGDAAGLAEPITGEGIAFALESAEAAAGAVEEALRRGRPDDAAGLYNAAVGRQVLPILRQAAWGRWALYPRPLLPRALASMRRNPVLARGFMDVLAGRATYLDYLRLVLGARLRGWNGRAALQPTPTRGDRHFVG